MEFQVGTSSIHTERGEGRERERITLSLFCLPVPHSLKWGLLDLVCVCVFLPLSLLVCVFLPLSHRFGLLRFGLAAFC